MRAFAEYVMHGRRQAIIVVLLCGFFPMLYFVSAAVVGLVSLRKGGYEGFLILLWSLLPALVLWQLGDATPLLLMLGSYMLALLLRRSGSWQQVILAATALGVLIQLSLHWQTGYMAQMQALVQDVINTQADPSLRAQYSTDQLVDLLLGFYGAYHVVALLVCLMLARWWQAMLYNPGGFQQEFHRLRFDPRVMLVLLGLLTGALMGVQPLEDWQALFTIPAIFGGLAVMHGTIALKKLGGHWLILCYLLLVMMSPVVIALGFIDSVMNFRKRITT